MKAASVSGILTVMAVVVLLAVGIVILIWAARRKKLTGFIASVPHFLVSFVFSLITVEIGRGYADYLPDGFGSRSEKDPDQQAHVQSEAASHSL